MITYPINFPRQRVSAATKAKAEWYAGCIDYIIELGLSFNDRSETETLISILQGDIPDSFYKKTLNPYNTNNEKYKRFPATMRNLDIMSDIVRRYVSEYYKGIHEYTVGASNPEVILAKNAKLREAVMQLAQQEFQRKVEENLQALQQQAQQEGTEVTEQDMQNAMPDVEQFVKEFNENYIDEQSKQGQDILDYIRSVTDDMILYLSAYKDYCTLGECYTYTDVRGEELVKEYVPAVEAYPIPNSKFFIEDHDMFARRMLLSYSQIMDMFDNVLDKKDREFLERYYDNNSPNYIRTKFLYSNYFEYYPDVCDKFTKEERELFKKENLAHIREGNNNLYEVWHVVWRGEAKRGILTYINEVGFPATRIVDETYKLNPEIGDIDIKWEYEPQVYEGYRIGTRYDSIYPIKCRPIPYQRDVKLPYNGLMEVLPMMGKFSIIKLVTPYQIMRNIFAYHREMVIAKNKMLVLLLPESLIADDTEDKIYKMAADGVLIVNDEEDATSQKMANIRMLNANLGDYIAQLTNLIESVKSEAREMVDMNMQRYGEIAQSAGASVTQEAISRSSMGSVIIVAMFDEMRRRDYQRDLEFAKTAYVDGLQTTYFDDNYRQRYLSLDVDTFISSDYNTMVKNDQKELDKIKQLQQWAFSAAQNGDIDMALAAITGNNVAQIKNTINQFMEIKRQHEEQMKQADQMIEQQKAQMELMKIQAQGEEDRKTQELKYQYEMQLKYADIDMAAVSAGLTNDESANRLKEMTEQNKTALAQQKLDLDRQKLNLDLYNAAADRQVKREDMQNQLRIARENKNKYDR